VRAMHRRASGGVVLGRGDGGREREGHGLGRRESLQLQATWLFAGRRGRA
jgi:hypothetical protein